METGEEKDNINHPLDQAVVNEKDKGGKDKGGVKDKGGAKGKEAQANNHQQLDTTLHLEDYTNHYKKTTLRTHDTVHYLLKFKSLMVQSLYQMNKY